MTVLQLKTLDGSTALSTSWSLSTHIEVVWGDVHQLMITGVESLQQHSVSSFTVQADLALWVTHWKWINSVMKTKCSKGSTQIFHYLQILRLLFVSWLNKCHSYIQRGSCMHCSDPCGLTALWLLDQKLLLRQEWFTTSDFWAVFQHLNRKTNHRNTQWNLAEG